MGGGIGGSRHREEPQVARRRCPECGGETLLAAGPAIGGLELLGDDTTGAGVDRRGHVLAQRDHRGDVDDHHAPTGQDQPLELLRGPRPIIGVEREIDGGLARERIEQRHQVASAVARGTRGEVPVLARRRGTGAVGATGAPLEGLRDGRLAAREFDDGRCPVGLDHVADAHHRPAMGGDPDPGGDGITLVGHRGDLSGDLGGGCIGDMDDLLGDGVRVTGGGPGRAVPGGPLGPGGLCGGHERVETHR